MAVALRRFASDLVDNARRLTVGSNKLRSLAVHSLEVFLAGVIDERQPGQIDSNIGFAIGRHGAIPALGQLLQPGTGQPPFELESYWLRIVVDRDA